MGAIIGLLKGGIVGGGLGFAFIYLGPLSRAGWANYLLYGLIGAVVGLIAGRPFWRKRPDGGSNIVVPAVRAVLGAGLSIGLYALVVKVLGDPTLSFAASWPQIGAAADAKAAATTVARLPYLLGGLIGIAYGVFVELDDGGKPDEEAKK